MTAQDDVLKIIDGAVAVLRSVVLHFEYTDAPLGRDAESALNNLLALQQMHGAGWLDLNAPSQPNPDLIQKDK